MACFRRSSSAHLICHVHNRASRSVRSEKHVGVLPTQDYLDYFAHTRDAKQVKSLASRLDAMKRNQKF